MGNRIYGCDDCLAVCPWNKFAAGHREMRSLRRRDDLDAPPLAELAALDDAGFRARFSGSPIKRIGRDRFLRNVLIAAGNSRAGGLIATVERHLGDSSPLVRGAAIWALGELDPDRAARQRQHRAPAESDPDVQAEWAALSTPEEVLS